MLLIVELGCKSNGIMRVALELLVHVLAAEILSDAFFAAMTASRELFVLANFSAIILLM